MLSLACHFETPKPDAMGGGRGGVGIEGSGGGSVGQEGSAISIYPLGFFCYIKPKKIIKVLCD